MPTAATRPRRCEPAVARRAAMVAVIALAAGGCLPGEDPAGDGTPEQAVETAATEDEVTVGADGLELVGTLRLPDGDGPHTGVVIAHGSGPSSRRGEAPGQLGLTLPAPVPVYEQLATGFRDAGYAVLTYDKRSCGPFNGCADNAYPPPPDDLTFGTFVDDLLAVVDHLAARDEVDRIVVVGHSKGGTVATEAAAGGGDLDGLVLLATPVAGVPELLDTQARTLRELTDAIGASGPEVDRAVEEVQALADDVAAVADGELDGPPVGGASRAFWASWIDAAATAPQVVGGLDLPVLVVGGANDWNVLPEQVEAWSEVVGDDRVIIVDDVTHALTRLAVDDPAAIAPADVGSTVDGAVVETLVAWLEELPG